MQLKIRIMGIVLLCLSALQVMAQDQTDWTLASAESLQTIVGEEYAPRFPALSPDGSVVGWWDNNKDQVCVYAFAEAETTCYETPEMVRPFGRFSYPSWSADGQSLAFTESFFDLFLESDLWVLDLESGSITNQTDDQVFGGILELDDGEAVPFDYLPTWNPATGELYFFRSTRGDDSWTTGLYRIEDGSTEPELVVDLSVSLPVLSVYRRAAISPDGTRMAINVIAQKMDDPQSGIYLIDLATGDLTKAAEFAELRTGSPDWALENTALAPEMIFWSENDGLVVFSSDTQFSTMFGFNAVYIDLASGDVSPLVDFSDVPEQSEFLKEPGPVTEMLRTGVVSPDGAAVWALRSGVGWREANIAAVALPPVEEEAIDLGDVPDFQIMPGSNMESFVSADGKVLMLGWVFTFEEGS